MLEFTSFAGAQQALLWGVFAVTFVMGATVNKTNFCTMGAVSDWVNMGDKGRFRAWLLAVAAALLGVTALEHFGLVNAGAAFPPYRAGQLLWAENLLGGLLFGIGMTLASGCGNKCLIRIGGGNLKSILVLLVVGTIAYFMINPFPGSDQTLFSTLFAGWLRPLAVNLGPAQDLGTLAAGADGAKAARLYIGGALALGLLLLVFLSAEFRRQHDNILGGLMVGLAVAVVWWLSSSILVQAEGDRHGLQAYVQQWDFLAGDEARGKPADSRQLAPQSLTFIAPMGQGLAYAAQGFSAAFLTTGVMALAGVVLGSLFWSLISKGFRIEWFASGRDFINHFIGAVLMGIGGVLAMGCTIGQAVTGVSTLALGSFIAFAGIVLGSALTMKVQYYRMVYEEASFLDALRAGLADLRLLPSSLRKLDAV
jgi:hypothetical protein